MKIYTSGSNIVNAVKEINIPNMFFYHIFVISNSSLIVEWDSDHRDCADLRGGGRFFAARCDASGPWLCKRDS